VWIDGDGRYASVSYCRNRTTVALSATPDGATEAKALIDRIGCGGFCSRRHIIVDLGTRRTPHPRRYTP
jgi:hypothetical protein